MVSKHACSDTLFVAYDDPSDPSLEYMMAVVDSTLRIIGLVVWYEATERSSPGYIRVPYDPNMSFPPTVHPELPADFPTSQSLDPFNIWLQRTATRVRPDGQIEAVTLGEKYNLPPPPGVPVSARVSEPHEITGHETFGVVQCGC